MEWGSDVDTTKTVNSTSLEDALESIGFNFTSDGFSAQTVASQLASDNVDANTFAYVIGQYISDTATGSSGTGTTSSGVTTASITVSEAGYYLVKTFDDSNPTPQEVEDAAYILQILGSANVEWKTSVPDLDKTVTSDTDDDDKTTADYTVGDDVPFTLVATLLSNYSAYKTYALTFHDALSDGLNFNEDSVVVTVYSSLDGYNGGSDAGTVVYSSNGGYTVATTGIITGENFNVVIADTNALYKDEAGSKGSSITVDSKSVIIVTYTAEILVNATNLNENTNTAYLEYSNDPTSSSKGTGEPEENTVFNFTLMITKTNEKSEALAGAGFTLYQEVKDSSEVTTDKGYYYVSDDGSLVEITTSSSVPADYSGVYYKFISMPTTTEGDTTGVNNKFAFTGLGIGNYVLMEITTPDGYNIMEDIYFTVSATTGYTGGTASVKTLQANVTSPSGSQQSKSISVEASTLSLYTTIQNSSSYVMPSGGGIGTTVFYVVGGVMIVGAGMLLITKRRMRSKK